MSPELMRLGPDPAAPILANQGLGGIPLRLPLREIENLSQLVGWDWDVKPSFRLDTPYSALYVLAGGAIDMFVDVRVGKVHLLCAYEGYTGTLLGGIRVGMRISDALTVHSGFSWNDDDELYRSDSVPGVSLWPEPHPEGGAALLDQQPIGRINVFAAEAYTPMGQLGYW